MTLFVGALTFANASCSLITPILTFCEDERECHCPGDGGPRRANGMCPDAGGAPFDSGERDLDAGQGVDGGPSAEICNGADDDADGAADEDFECVMNASAEGLNACGRVGLRRCSESCTWLDGAFVLLEETSETCDYCDDTGRGLGEERVIAVSMHDTTTTAGWDLHGDATFVAAGDPHYALAPSPNAQGAVFAPDPVRVGYGVMTVVAQVRTYANATASCSPFPCSTIDGSWSVVLLLDGAASFLDDTDADGIPSEPGVAVTWRFSHFDPSAGFQLEDMVQLSSLGSAGRTTLMNGFPPAGVRQDGPAGNSVLQQLTLELTPDDPTTPTDETALEVVAPAGVGLRCANAGTPSCGVSLVPGGALHLGVAGAALPEYDVSVTRPSLRLVTAGACPE
jgi:hypothetical protein